MPKKLTYDKIDINDKKQIRALADHVLENLEKGMPLQQAVGLSDESMEEIYSLAYGFYNQGKFTESLSLFQFLSSASPTTYKYILGLASSLHQLQSYEEAAIGFCYAFNLDPDDPIPTYFATDCFLKLNRNEEAEELADVTIAICGDKPEFQELKTKCELIKKKLRS